MRLSCISFIVACTLATHPLLAFEPLATLEKQQDTTVATVDAPEATQIAEPADLTPLPELAQSPLLPEADFDLMLIGGGIATCSSMATTACQTSVAFSASAKTSNRYALQPTTLQLLANADIFTTERQPLQTELVALFTHLAQSLVAARSDATAQAANLHEAALSEADLTQLWRTAEASDQVPDGGEALWQKLSERELNAIFDYLEVPVFSDDGKYRLTEHAALSGTTTPESIALYQQFVALSEKRAQAKGRSKAQILVVTASSRDPFASVDFYLDVFRQAGADAQWLPLSAALQHAVAAKNCQALPQYLAQLHGSYRREQIYADLFNDKQQLCQQGNHALTKLIAAADGIFFNGGDQSLAYQALRYADGTATPTLQAIIAAVQHKQLVVAGTSAGTAVMSGNQLNVKTGPAVPMITNGDSYHALQYGAKPATAPWPGCRKEQRCPEGNSERQLTYLPAGGLGLFPLGILDTHFAERGRQARLLVLQQATQSTLAFGIDETTALLVDLGNQHTETSADHHASGLIQLAVSGAGEVFISSLLPESNTMTLQAHSYHLSLGDSATWQDGTLRVKAAPDKSALTGLAEPLQSRSPLFSRDNYRSLSHSLCRSNFASATVSEPPYLIRLAKAGDCAQAADGKLHYEQRVRITAE